MPPRTTYRSANREFPGYGAVINGNFVEVGPFMGGFIASVQAYHLDPDEQHQRFDTLAEAVAWGAAIARTHQGRTSDTAPYPTAQWEITDGCSITARRLPSGEYESNWLPMWAGEELERSLTDNPKPFPTPEEAMADARQQAARWNQNRRDRETMLLEIKAALEAAPGD